MERGVVSKAVVAELEKAGLKVERISELTDLKHQQK